MSTAAGCFLRNAETGAAFIPATYRYKQPGMNGKDVFDLGYESSGGTTTSSAQVWIAAGYGLFAAEGPKGLKVEVMARQVGKSKSSFYHHFADLECFVELLLASHHNRAMMIADRERLCNNVVPELLNVLLEVKQDLLFNRQLRIHRAHVNYRDCFEKSSRGVAEAILPVWAEMLGLRDNSQLARMVLNLSIENFYLQITPETLSYNWLLAYMSELKRMVKEFQLNGPPNN